MKRLEFTVKIKEPFSALTHFIGIFLAIAGLVLLVTYAALAGKPWHTACFAIFGASMVLVYIASTLYHWLPLRVSHEKLFRRIDQSMIYLLIAGTYTPICVVALPQPWGWLLFGVVWAVGLAGIFLQVSRSRVPRRISTTLYLTMGWIAVAAINPLTEAFPFPGIAWLVGGGVAYTVGAVVYALKRPNPLPKIIGAHEVFHLFVMLGSFCHFWFMFHYVLPIGGAS